MTGVADIDALTAADTTGSAERAHARTAPAQTPVTVITGFLGSGKTTLIARLLRHPGLENTAVIVYEFGEVGLDEAKLAMAQAGLPVRRG